MSLGEAGATNVGSPDDDVWAELDELAERRRRASDRPQLPVDGLRVPSEPRRLTADRRREPSREEVVERDNDHLPRDS